MGGRSLRPVILVLWALVAVVAIGVGTLLLGRNGSAPGEPDAPGAGDYELATTESGTFTQASLAGGPTAVFFGFTHCPDICPTTLADIDGWQAELKARGEEPLQVYFVTVDPERDTRELLGDYVSWVPGVTGVTGSPAEIDKAIDGFHIYAKKVPLESGGYTMDHSSMVMLFDRNGEFFDTIAYQEDTEIALDKIERLKAS